MSLEIPLGKRDLGQKSIFILWGYLFGVNGGMT